MHGDRDAISDRAVASILVIVPTPILQLFSGIYKADGPMRVQAFRPKLTFEGAMKPLFVGLPKHEKFNVALLA